ncbi:Aminopeptidase N [Camponotus japonicus]
MICFKLLFITLLYIILIFISATASFSEENYTDLTNPFLPDYIIPFHYKIYIMLLPYDELETTNFIGKCHVYLNIYHPTSTISLHAQKPQIEINYAILINKTLLEESWIKPKRYIPQYNAYNNESHILNFHFKEEISSGDYLLIMNFTGSLNDNNESIFKNSYVDSTGHKTWLYVTHFQTIGARQIFPCWDEPKFKATFNISIKHRKEYTVFSNMDYRTKIHLINSKMQWTHFDVTPKISTYQVAFCLSTEKWFKFFLSFHNRLHSSNDSSDIIVWNRIPFQIPFAAEVVKKSTIYSENNLKNFEISTIQHVFMPSLRYDAIGKWGFVLYRETAIIYDEKIDSLAHKIEVACLIARQIAYQWFDNTVSPSWWSHYWLNQGIATLLGIDILDKYFADFRTSDLFVVQTQQESLRLDTYSIMKPLSSEIEKPSEIHSLLSFSYYTKGPAILRMLQHVLTHEIFGKGIEKFYKTHMFRSVTLNDFYDVMQIVYNSEKEIYMKSFIIRDIMDAWTKQEHYPVLKVKNKIPYLRIEIENNDSLNLQYDWWIPITITKQTEPDFTISKNWHVYDEWVSHENYFNQSLYFYVQKDEWYIINLQQIGYYRVNYETKNWQNIARYLKSTKYINIHVLNRAQIIDDAYYFVKAGTLNFSIFLELTEYLSRETDYIAWYPMFKALEDISSIFPFQDEKSNVIKTKILNSLNGLLRNIDYDKKPDEKTDDLIDCLRQEATKWACILGALNCMKTAEIKLHQYLTNIETNELLPWWKDWTFCNGLMRASSSIWNKVWNIHIKNSSVITSKFLACSGDSAAIIKYTEMLFNDYIEGKRNNVFNDFHYIIARHANNKEILDFILRNLKKIPR